MVQLHHRIYWMNFPKPERVKELGEALNARYKEKYFIWNVSEYTYDSAPFNNQV